MKDLGFIHYFLDVEVQRFNGGLSLNKAKYAAGLIAHAQMCGFKSLSTLMVTKLCLSSTDDETFDAPHFYCSIIGGLQYRTFTHPELAFSVNHVCQYMRQPLKSHFMLVKGILRYSQGTITHGIRLLSHSSLFLYGF